MSGMFERFYEAFEAHCPPTLRLRVEEILEALDQGDLKFAREPVIDVKDASIVYEELLMRLEDADGEAIAPAAVLPMLQTAGLLPWFELMLIDKELEYVNHRQIIGGINLSPFTLVDEETRRAFYDLLDHWFSHQVDPEQVVFEVLETSPFPNRGLAVHLLAEIAGRGVRLALDDFGCEHHADPRCLDYTVWDFVKIDRELLEDIGQSTKRTTLFEQAKNYAELHGVRLIGEGVRSMARGQQLARSFGLHLIQDREVGPDKLLD